MKFLSMKANRHGNSGDQWTEVRRRKHTALTSFYVSNIPEDCNKDDIKTIFQEFGKVVDVYIASKKNKAGLCFGFVRFSGVHDVKKLKASLPKIKCGHNILEVNAARYQKKKPQDTVDETTKMKQPQYNQPAPINHQPHGSRSYVDTAKAPPPPRLPVIHINPAPHMGTWMKSKCHLFGETASIDHLRSIPELIDTKRIPDVKIYYLGGLRILLTFRQSSEVDAFSNELILSHSTT